MLEEALSTLLRHPIETVGAGRTDAGVHAIQMFAHFEADGIDDQKNFEYRLNAILPDAIAVQRIFTVPDDAHARFDAIQRTYEYWMVQEKNPFYSDFAYHMKHSLDIIEMNKAAAVLLEYEDFESFSKSNTDVKTYRCAIKNAFWKKKDDKLVFTITADRFLRNMVRAVVGTLLEVGQEKWTPTDVKRILKGKDRSLAGPSVPAKGLYLTSILYPENILNRQ